MQIFAEQNIKSMKENKFEQMASTSQSEHQVKQFKKKVYEKSKMQSKRR